MFANNARNQSSTAAKRLLKEYRDLVDQPVQGIMAGPCDESDMFLWEALIEGPEGTPYEGGVFAAQLKFPTDYPMSPFSMTFIPSILHPNIYPNGLVCISILHAPGDDPMRYEQASERWSPVQGVRSVLLSVLSMLHDPNDESPADVEAAKLRRTDNPEFERRVREQVKSLLDI